MIFQKERVDFCLILTLAKQHRTEHRREKRITLIYFCPTTTYATVHFLVCEHFEETARDRRTHYVNAAHGCVATPTDDIF